MLTREQYKELSCGLPTAIDGFYWRPFSNWSTGENIAKYPRVLRPLILLIRNIKLNWLPRRLPFHYFADGIASKLPMTFLSDQDFVRCYERMIQAAGTATDPGLHFRIHQAIWAARHAYGIEGDFVECGTGRGMVMSAVLESLTDWNHGTKTVWLFDTFSPFSLDPESGFNDSSRGRRWNYAIDVQSTEKNFQNWSRVRVVPGRLPESLDQLGCPRIAFLHLDLNNAASEKSVLEVLWQFLSPGAVVLFDDYGQNITQQRAMDEFVADHGHSILTTGSGQGVLIRL